MAKRIDTSHIRDASPEQARQLAYHYYTTRVSNERALQQKLTDALIELSRFKSKYYSLSEKYCQIEDIING